METKQVIKPAIGSPVRFFPATAGDADITPLQVGEIAYLWSDTCANIQFTLPDGRLVVRSSVPLFQQGIAHGCAGYYAELIPPLHTATEAEPVDTSIEAEIQAKGLTAPRITPDDVQANIVSEHYFTAEEGMIGKYANRLAKDGVGTYPGDLPKQPKSLGLLTFCVLTLENDFTVTGESACASPENFNADIGRRIARENAVAKIWPLMGYELRSLLKGDIQRPGEIIHLTASPGQDLRDIVAGMSFSPNARQHTEDPDHGHDEQAIGDASDGVGEGPAGETSHD